MIKQVLLGVLFSVFWIQTHAQDGACVKRGILGGEVPVPFALINQRVELADQECYTLVGSCDGKGGASRIHIDLTVHPWLANQERIAYPFYYITRTPRSLLNECRAHSGIQMKFFVKAHSLVRRHADGSYYPAIELEILETPELYTRE